MQQSLNEFFSSLVLSMVLKNGDAHLKNYGLLYTHPQSDDCRLSPVYDIVCTTVYMPKDLPALTLAKRKEWPTRKELVEFGRDTCRVHDADGTIDRIVGAANGYTPGSDESGIWKKMKVEIDSAARSLAKNKA